ncbi:unnamed protein product [Spirodela intermedia]|uniref:Lumazine-binding domain-containing protein n=1 Tax=Spirodela intermedia TaxID=51605 RepID=A0A7I8ISV6_SPIIN|nr:unnamed protein product [Spirodela intermedia]CAA6661093.1 unnamed protein product [Spirodela intermedia]
MAISSPIFCGSLGRTRPLFFREHSSASGSIPPPVISIGVRRLPFFTYLRSVPPISPLFNPRPRRSIPAIAAAPVRSLFTGIVEEVGKIEQLGPSADGGFEMTIAASTVLGGASLGDSISVNGTCLTVTRFDHQASNFSVGLSPETLRKTSLGELGVNSPVNLERALRPDSRMGGHFVQGHIDGTGEIVSFEPEGDSLWVKVRTASDLLRYVVPKGFIAVYDEENCFDFMLVAYTQQNVVIPLKKVGDKVNLEVDILGKYVERILKAGFGYAPAGVHSPP